jgi:adenylylsulfate reductase subunit B
MPPVIDKNKCSACGLCRDICPTDVFAAPPKGEPPVIRYPEECWHCNACGLDCPEEAISLRFPLPTMMLFVDAPGKGGNKADA